MGFHCADRLAQHLGGLLVGHSVNMHQDDDQPVRVHFVICKSGYLFAGYPADLPEISFKVIVGQAIEFQFEDFGGDILGSFQ